MVGRQEHLYGNILFYDYLSKKRAPVALNRNLTRALQIHRHLSEKTNAIGLVGDHYDLRTFWKPPARDALDDMVEREKSRGICVLEIHKIARTATAIAKRPTDSVEPTRKAQTLLHLKSSIKVAVFPPLSSRDCLSKSPQQATLRSTSRQVDKEVRVETERISIDPRGFHVPVTGAKGAYKLSISINLESRETAEALQEHFALKRPITAPTHLSATWPDLLQCHSGKISLPLKDSGSSLGLSLEVSMHWTPVTGESILTKHNQHIRASAPQPAACATPSPTTGDCLPTYKITYVYAQKTMKRYDLGCPHPGCEKRGHDTDIQGLRMHLDSLHAFFRYEATKGTSEVDGEEVWVFEGVVSDHRHSGSEQRASDRTADPRDIQYLNGDNDHYRRTSRVNKRYAAPKATGTVPTNDPIPLRRKPPGQVQNRPAREKKKYPVPEGPAGVTFFRSCSRRPLVTGECISESDDDVDDSWIKLRKSAEFDGDEQIPSFAKHFLKAYDSHMWSEQLQSDIHVGDAVVRFAREHRHWIWQEGVSVAFTDKMHELLQDDIISQEVHTGCLEIVESAKPDVAEGGIELSQRLAQMEVSHNELYADPPRLRKTRSPELPTSADLTGNGRKRGARQTKANKGTGKARVTEMGQLTPVSPDSDGDLEMRAATLMSGEDFADEQEESNAPPLPYDLCLCGKDAQSSTRGSQMIACASMDCIRRCFHFDCIKERWKVTQNVRDLRKSAWICEDCKSHSATGI